MAINFMKRVFVLATILIVVLLLPTIALAAPAKLDISNRAIITQTAKSLDELNLTPQQRQQLQALHQGRNREINAVLNSSQRAKLAKSIQVGGNFNQALESLDLQPDQREMLKAIAQIRKLKIKALWEGFFQNK